jgi:hypothetical protein
MSHSNDDKRSAAPAAAGKPTLEALLRVKRAERPDQAFWEEFERGLHRKQLASIVEPKPWWLGLAIWGRRLAPVGLPASAAAAALLAVMVVRTQSPFSSTPPVQNDHSSSEIARLDKSPATLAALASSGLIAGTAPGLAEPHTSAAVALVSPTEAADASPASSSTLIEAADSVASVPAAPAASGPVAIPLVDSLLELGAASPAPTPSESTIAENLAAVRTENPDMILAAAPVSNGDGEALVDDLAIEPALKMEVRNPRHARVLLAMADNPSVETPGGLTSLRDRAARGLDHEDSLSGSASRLGVGGDRFSVSF